MTKRMREGQRREDRDDMDQYVQSQCLLSRYLRARPCSSVDRRCELWSLRLKPRWREAPVLKASTYPDTLGLPIGQKRKRGNVGGKRKGRGRGTRRRRKSSCGLPLRPVWALLGPFPGAVFSPHWGLLGGLSGQRDGTRGGGRIRSNSKSRPFFSLGEHRGVAYVDKRIWREGTRREV